MYTGYNISNNYRWEIHDVKEDFSHVKIIQTSINRLSLYTVFINLYMYKLYIMKHILLHLFFHTKCVLPKYYMGPKLLLFIECLT